MLRILNVLAIVALVGSAVYAYSIKYATLYQAERMAKLKRELQSETDSVAMLRAEWSHVANPVRIEVLADKYLGGQVMQLSQITTFAGLPEKAARGDEIGAKLQDLGLAEPTNTPAAASAFSATPAAPKPATPAAPKPATPVALKPATSGR
ncbi:cell division protein FtsL [Rhodoblastus sp.]|uniref:cell division protein FtsL n=1 Tax=Rhodoblastus sp. TaxID=1962975 RepID=UPI003F9C84BD